MSSQSRLEIVYKDLAKEHRRIMTLIERLRAEENMSGMLPLLEKLRTVVIVHFAREQLPDGFYEALGEGAQQWQARIQTLINDHADILAELNALQADLKAADPGAQSGYQSRIAQLIEHLYDHEQREHGFATEVMKER